MTGPQGRPERMVGDGTESWHGTIGGYNNHRCRCNRCRAANREWMRGWRGRPQPALQALLKIHQYLFPERYPENTDHIYWDGGEPSDPAWQWQADTIEAVAEMVEDALRGHPDARLEGG